MKLAVAVRPSNPGFQLPEGTTTPIIMVGAGSGVAPFRGFAQELSLRGGEQSERAQVLLFFGCSHPEVDFLYRGEFAQWEREGILQVRPAFSKPTEGKSQYVQDRLWDDRAEVMGLIERGAKIYVCGDGRRMASAVRETFARIYQEQTDCADSAVERWLTELENSLRYVVDVFA